MVGNKSNCIYSSTPVKPRSSFPGVPVTIHPVVACLYNINGFKLVFDVLECVMTTARRYPMQLIFRQR